MQELTKRPKVVNFHLEVPPGVRPRCKEYITAKCQLVDLSEKDVNMDELKGVLTGQPNYFFLHLQPDPLVVFHYEAYL
jgi:hypothetical protein